MGSPTRIRAHVRESRDAARVTAEGVRGTGGNGGGARPSVGPSGPSLARSLSVRPVKPALGGLRPYRAPIAALRVDVEFDCLCQIVRSPRLAPLDDPQAGHVENIELILDDDEQMLSGGVDYGHPTKGGERD